MSSDELVLIDLPSRAPCKSWSLNPWKTRLLLNYKKLPYRTQWVEYPDLKPTLEGHVPPGPGMQDMMHYTSPTVIFPDGKYVMDSQKIRAEVEQRYPEPSVHLDSPILPKLEELMTKLRILGPIYAPRVAFNLLTEPSKQYFLDTRAKMFSMPLEQLQREKGGVKVLQQAKPQFDEITKLLKEDSSGPYFMGQTISYADFVWASYLIFFQRVDVEVYQELMKVIGESDVHAKLLLALDPYTQRNDH